MLKGEQTRRKILEKAAPLFNKRGFNGCSMQDISAATGLEKGSLYTHFHSKEQLASEAFDTAWAQSSGARVDNLDRTQGSIEKLKLHIDNFVAKPPFAGGCPLLNAAMDADDGNPALYRRAQKAFHGWSAFLTQIIEQGQTSGELTASVDPEALATLIISLLEGAFFTSRLQRSKSPLKIAQQHLNQYLDQAVRKLPLESA
jgi:TetR/AcrR family transcriptional regulator, transcriptional repressor for nem operon